MRVECSLFVWWWCDGDGLVGENEFVGCFLCEYVLVVFFGCYVCEFCVLVWQNGDVWFGVSG